MTDQSVFSARLPICKACEFWKGACLKGHALHSDFGCPLKKFEGVNGAAYLDDLPVPMPELPESGGTCCGGSGGEIKPMSWMQVWDHLNESMAGWAKTGFAVLSGAPYVERINICKSCPKKQYRWFQCRHCRCCVYAKAKLAHETCPFGLWPKVVSS
jgi:hypothetical protein